MQEPTAGLSESHATLAMEAVALNRADILTIEGRYQEQPPPPFTPGKEGCGVIIDAPADSPWHRGDRVVAYASHGAFAQQWQVPLAQLWHQPPELSVGESAGVVISWSSAWFGLFDRGQLQPGETVLIHAGAGGFGQAAIQLAHRHGARVLATAGGKVGLELCRTAGAEHAINYRTHSFKDEVLAATDGRGVDLILETVGGAILDDSIRCLTFGGRLVVAGFSSGEIPAILANRIMLRHISLTGLNWPAMVERQPKTVAYAWQQICQAFAEGLRPTIGPLYSIQQLPEAISALQERRTTGKVTLIFAE